MTGAAGPASCSCALPCFKVVKPAPGSAVVGVSLLLAPKAAGGQGMVDERWWTPISAQYCVPSWGSSSLTLIQQLTGTGMCSS